MQQHDSAGGRGMWPGRMVALGAAVALAAGCSAQDVATTNASPTTQPRPIAADTAGPEVRAAMTRADEAIGELQRTLQARLTAAMGEGGPTAAVTVCRDEAQSLTQSIAAQRGVELGRTSHRVRNPVNAPRAWAAAVVASHEGRSVADVGPQVFDLGGRIGVLKPIGTQPLCVTCHGPREAVDAAIGDVLSSAYPDDRAVGFAPGDLRGWFWAEVALP